jgi:hypothetical protein
MWLFILHLEYHYPLRRQNGFSHVVANYQRNKSAVMENTVAPL